MGETLYTKVGGKESVTELVDKLYSKILKSPITSPQFEGRDVDHIKAMQVEFFSNAMGAPEPYTGMGMKEVHTGLNITDEQFNAVASYLEDSMKEMGMEDSDISTVMNMASGLKDQIVGL